MKPIKEGELYEHLGGFLKAKGLELKEGSYTRRIQRSCALLSDVINTSQRGIERAKVEAGRKLDRLRQVIHEKTAPKPPPIRPRPQDPGARKKSPAAPASAPKPRARRKTKHSA